MDLPWEVVIASSDVESRRALANMLERLGIEPFLASTVRECKEILAINRVGLIFCSRTLADGNCYDLLNASRGGRPKPMVVVTSSVTDWDEFLEAMRLGAFDVIACPCRSTDVEWMVLQALRHDRIHAMPIASARSATA